MSEEVAGAQAGERRQHKRQVSMAHKLVRASLAPGGSDDAEEVYLYLVDISEGGMRVNLDRTFPEGNASRLEFALGGQNFQVTVMPQWQRCLADGLASSGTWAAGLEFINPDRKSVDFLFQYFSTQGRRQRFRLRELLTVTMRREGDEAPWYSLTTLDLSTEGLRARFDESLELGEMVDVKLFPPDLPDVEGRARVMWTNEVLPGARWEFGVQFTELTAAGHDSLLRYIDRCVGA